MNTGKVKFTLVAVGCIGLAGSGGYLLGCHGNDQMHAGHVQAAEAAEIRAQDENRSATSDKIAIVNLDEGINESGKYVNYTEAFVRMPGENFEFASLEEAKSGVESGVYGGYMIIPADFSSCIYSINDQPREAQISYAVSPTLSEVRKYSALYEILRFGNSLNDSLSYMYMNNILTEFHEAQDGAKAVMENDLQDKEAIERLQSSDLITLMKIPEMKETAPPPAVEISDNSAAASDLIFMLDDQYKSYVSDMQGQLREVEESGAGLRDQLTSMREVSQDSDPFYNENGQSIIDHADADLEAALRRMSTPEISEKIEGLKEKSAYLSNSLDDSLKRYDQVLRDKTSENLTSLAVGLRDELPELILEEADGEIVLRYRTDDETAPVLHISKSSPQKSSEGDLSFDAGDTNQDKGAAEKVVSGAGEGTAEKVTELVIRGDVEKFKSYIPDKVEYAARSAGDTWGATDDADPEIFKLHQETEEILKELYTLNEEAGDLETVLGQAREDCGEQIRDVFRTSLIQPLQERYGAFREKNLQRYTQEIGSIQSYEHILQQFSPAISDAFITQYVQRVQENNDNLYEKVEKHVQDCTVYAAETKVNADDALKQLKDRIEETNVTAARNLEEGLSDVKQIKAQTSEENQKILNDFSTRLPYTRLGSLEYTRAYRFMTHPSVLQELPARATFNHTTDPKLQSFRVASDTSTSGKTSENKKSTLENATSGNNPAARHRKTVKWIAIFAGGGIVGALIIFVRRLRRNGMII